jgi:hypothetical protein
LEEKERSHGLNVFHKVVNGMTFTRRLSTSVEDTRRRDTNGSNLKVKLEDIDPEQSKFDLPNTPLEIQQQNSKVVGGLFPGKGFFYLPKTTIFDTDSIAPAQIS